MRVSFVGKLRKNATGPCSLFCLRANEQENDHRADPDAVDEEEEEEE